MKQIVCEMCGEKKFTKEEGYYLCQTCGMKYSIDEAKKLMVEVECNTNKENFNADSNEIERLFKNAESTALTGNYSVAYDIYTQILTLDPDNIIAQVRRMSCMIAQGDISNTHLDQLDNIMICALNNNLAKNGENKEFFDSSLEAIKEANNLIVNVYKICLNYLKQTYGRNEVSEILSAAMLGMRLGKGNLTGAIIHGTSALNASNNMINIKDIMHIQSANCYNASLHICNFMLENIRDKKNSPKGMWLYLLKIANNMPIYTMHMLETKKVNAKKQAENIKEKIENVIKDINDLDWCY